MPQGTRYRKVTGTEWAAVRGGDRERSHARSYLVTRFIARVEHADSFETQMRETKGRGQ